MHIECILKREGGSKIPLGENMYHFAPQPDGAHVALVADTDHQDRFLSIAEAYRLYRGKHKPASTVETTIYSDGIMATGPAPLPVLSPEQQDKLGDNILLGSDEHDASYTIHGTNYALGDIVARAQADSGMSADEWNALSDAGRADLIDDQLDKLQASGPAPTEAPTDAPAAAPKKRAKRT